MIVANWKMNGSKDLIASWISNFSSSVELNQDRLCILMPPSCYMEFVNEKILEERINLKLGSQTFTDDASSPLTGGVSLDMLLELQWIKPKGRRQSPGRPLTWGTTEIFLDVFGLQDLSALPGMSDLKSAGLVGTKPLITDDLSKIEDNEENEQNSLIEKLTKSID